MTKAGYCSIIGLPNSGKSTLLNSFLGQKLAITNSKPQTTRKRILGILSEEEYQIIFFDTPGALKPSYLLQERFLAYIMSSAKDADVINLLIDINDEPHGEKTFANETVMKILDLDNKKKILALNKIDLIKSEKEIENAVNFFMKNTNAFDAVIPISASANINLDTLKKKIIEFLPEHPKYYPDDLITDENERFFVSEIIREKILEIFHEEIPYSVEVVIEDFKERNMGKDYISASIVVEKESQKPILIGKEGSSIKKLGEIARKEIENFLEREVFLELRIKVKEKWRNDKNMLKRFGYYNLPED